ncbi:MAG: hypothetical protein WCE21_02175 [Candidatus Babeliales bacterium]
MLIARTLVCICCCILTPIHAAEKNGKYRALSEHAENAETPKICSRRNKEFLNSLMPAKEKKRWFGTKQKQESENDMHAIALTNQQYQLLDDRISITTSVLEGSTAIDLKSVPAVMAWEESMPPISPSIWSPSESKTLLRQLITLNKYYSTEFTRRIVVKPTGNAIKDE